MWSDHWGLPIETHSERLAQTRGPKLQPFRTGGGEKMLTRFVRFCMIWGLDLGVWCSNHATRARVPAGRPGRRPPRASGAGPLQAVNSRTTQLAGMAAAASGLLSWLTGSTPSREFTAEELYASKEEGKMYGFRIAALSEFS